VLIEKLFQLVKGWRHILARKPDPEMVTGMVVHAAGQQEHTAFVDEFITKSFHIPF
jgi:hypothetical protein